MCGIVGIAQSGGGLLGNLVDGLSCLEYRGYDSAGVALLGPEGLYRKRAVGKVDQLRAALQEDAVAGRETARVESAWFGMAHTRWATHGAVTEANAHPQSDGYTTVVHNGILENVADLRRQLTGVTLTSQTDTELIVHLVSKEVRGGMHVVEAVQQVLSLLRGTWALLLFHTDFPDFMIAARRESPLSVATYESGVSLASDVSALSKWGRSFVDLEDGEMAVIQRENGVILCHFQNEQGREVVKSWQPLELAGGEDSHPVFEDATLKEIYEQPSVIRRMMEAFRGREFEPILEAISQAQMLGLIGCGSSFYASLIGKYLFEIWGRVSAQAEVASEFRYRAPVLNEHSFYLFLSQSGETLDTLQAMEMVRAQKISTGAVTNVAHSSMAKRADAVIPLRAGPEVSVVSTKAFTAQLAALVGILLRVAKQRQSRDVLARLQKDAKKIPELLEEILRIRDDAWKTLVQQLLQASVILFLGRGVLYPVALEGALKLKETSYLHAEGYPAGELKHGPIALVDVHTVSVFLAPWDELFPKVLSNAQETLARGGTAIFLTDAIGQREIEKSDLPQGKVVTLVAPETGEISKSFVYSVLCQMLAYKVAKFRGCNVDRPRNLAKAVTVE